MESEWEMEAKLSDKFLNDIAKYAQLNIGYKIVLNNILSKS